MASANSILPHVLAAVNVSTVVSLTGAYVAIRSGDRQTHRKYMIAALGFGAAFMVLYLSYHFGAGLAKFGGEGLIRPIYFAILVVHIIAAAVATPLIPITAYRALSDQVAAHKRVALWSWRLWMFVAVSGLVVYVMTIHVWPFRGVPA